MGSRSKYQGRRSVPFSKQPNLQQNVTHGGVPLDQLQQQKAMQEAQVRARVEGLAAAVYAQNVDLDFGPTVDAFENHCSETAQVAIDAALIFAREVWGIQGKRMAPAVCNDPDVEAPQPIIEG